MTDSLVRRYLFGVLALAAAGLAQAQTIEVYAGGATFRNTPGQQMPVVPTAVTIGPDGMVYVSDASKGRLIRFDPVTGTATALPGLDPQPPFGNVPHDFDFEADALAMNPAGELYGATWQEMFRINVQEGTRDFLTGDPWSTGTRTQMTFDANGNLYYLKRDNAIYSATNLFRRGPWGYTESLLYGYDGGFHGDGGPLAWAGMSHARGVALDAQGNLYIADTDSHRVRKITAINGEINREESIITTVAGNGEWDSDDEGVPATSTALASPEALAGDAAGNLYIHESWKNRIRRVSAVDGTISTYAGNGPWGYTGDGGPAVDAHIDLVFGNIALDAASNLYLAEMGANRLRRVNAATGIIETVLGNGTMTFCTEASSRLDACLGGPMGVAVDASGNVYVSDSRNMRIRRIDATTGELRTIAGNGFSYTHGGDGGPATAATFAAEPGGISFDASGNLLIAGTWGNNVRRIDAATGIITTIAGTGTSGFAGDGGLATAAQFNNVQDAVADAAGNVYVADASNYRIRRISASGIVSTIAGNGSSTYSGEGIPATSAGIAYPDEIKVDASGNVLFASGSRLRRVDAVTGIITTIVGNGSGSGTNTGDGGPAAAAGIGYPFTFQLDGAGNIFLMAGGVVRRIDAATGIITSISPPYGMSTTEGKGVQYPTAMAFSPLGGLFVTDSESDLVFRFDGLQTGANDTTPPVITPVINGDAGVEGWYRSNVAVSWSVTDSDSTVTSSNGCSATSVSEDTAGVSFTCSATSAGGTATQSVTIRRDTVTPVINIIGFPEPDAFGWFNHNVAVDFWADDALSGVYSQVPYPLLFQQEGVGVHGQLVVTDRAGNVATYDSPAFNIDKTPPSIYSNRPGPEGNDDWYTESVQIDYTVEDSVSPIRSQEGCDDPVFSTDSPGKVFVCTATSTGGTTTSTMTLKRDATPPTLVFGPPSPAPNAAGWHSGDVSFPFTTSDGTSGVASTSISGPVVITGEGTGLTATVTVTDVAGNSASFSTPAVNIARSPPVVQPVINGTLGSNGWYTSNVQVSWNVTGNIQSSTGCATSNVVTDTAGVTFTCTAISAAGTASQSVTVKRDATAPVLTFGTPSPAANVNGWNKTNVSISFTRSDAMSGLASTSATSPIVLSTEGAGITGQVVVTDLAGNAATFTTVPRNIDKAAPYAEIQVPEDGATYGFYANAIAQYECVDISLVSCTGPNAIGELINTKTAGLNSYKITAKDQSLFTTTHTHTFTVASTFNFDGFLAPANDPPTLNLVTRGSLVPVRWRLPDGHGGFVSNTASFTSATVATLTCGSTTAVPLNDTASGPAGISFDSGTNTFTYNWQTTASWTGCRKLTIKLKDNSTHELRFKFQ